MTTPVQRSQEFILVASNSDWKERQCVVEFNGECLIWSTSRMRAKPFPTRAAAEAWLKTLVVGRDGDPRQIRGYSLAGLSIESK